MAKAVKLSVSLVIFLMLGVIVVAQNQEVKVEADKTTITIEGDNITLSSAENFGDEVVQNPCDKEGVMKLRAENKFAEVPEGLQNLGFGVGIGLSGLFRPEVNEVVMENGTVRITDEQWTRREFWLETHYLIYQSCLFDINRPYGHGPFAAVSVLNDQGLFNSVGLGWLVSLKRTEATDLENTSAFNVGVGVQFTGFDVLRDDLVEGEKIPAGAESNLLKRVDGLGWLIMVSFSF